MKTIYFLLALIICNSNLKAQSTDSTSKLAAKKHEFGAILNPVGVVLLGAEPTGQRIGFLYKKSLKTPGVYFTSGLYYQGYSNKFNKKNELTLEVNGLLRNLQYNVESSNKTMLSFGAEKRWTVSKCPAIVTYLGFEYLLSYGIDYSNVGSQWMKTDTTHGVEYSIQNLEAVTDYELIKKSSKTSIGGGMQFNAGIQVYVTKRCYIFAQTSPSFIFTRGTRVDENIITKTNTKYTTSQFDFDQRALVSDLGLMFKF